ncbi:transposase IS200-family protein [Thermocrinis albus DSM 14484]|uniref:Transposase IS200-family protein n=1 Tax=Thermocrinis albus (strain DSM 14484 / JCM 11386 / HI 11/12) TaxID=638303 RepID=D3SQG6_THEAH|nr:IS200/IS605 family transposase [Thermocrinis albus]ADC89403.1 transposase IS200-family protein [Thermocrinis albus DSM 14484]
MVAESEKLVKVKSTPHAKYQIAYHFVWIPKYRKEILRGEIKEFLENLFKGIAQEYRFEILAMEIMPDHIHLFVSAPPKYSPSNIAKIFKGVSAKKLFQRFPQLRKEYWKNHLWAPSYYVGTVGQVSAETIRRYIEECQNL